MKSFPHCTVELNHTSVLFRTATAQEVYPLRMNVLIAGTDRNSPEFSGDLAKTTIHVLGQIGPDVVTIGSWMLTQWNSLPAYQLRGMATAPEWRNHGLAKALLHYSEQLLASIGTVPTIWCNARAQAEPFYLKQGWIRASEAFDIPGVGPHFKLIKELSCEKSPPHV